MRGGGDIPGLNYTAAVIPMQEGVKTSKPPAAGMLRTVVPAKQHVKKSPDTSESSEFPLFGSAQRFLYALLRGKAAGQGRRLGSNATAEISGQSSSGLLHPCVPDAEVSAGFRGG